MTTSEQKDQKEILGNYNISWEFFKNTTVLVTGATGLIGKNLLYSLENASSDLKLNINLIAHGRNKKKAKELYENMPINFITGDIREPLQFDNIQNIDYVIHCAGIVNSADMFKFPVDTIETSVKGTQNIMQLAIEKECKKIIYISSMEVYGEDTKTEVKEDDLGYINLNNVRNCYPESKRLCELLSISYAHQYNLNVNIARVPLTFDNFAITNLEENRVLNQFFRKSINEESIEMHTHGLSTTTCMYMTDVVAGLLTILTKGENKEIYNIGNMSCSLTIRELAELVAKTVSSNSNKKKVDVIIKIPENIKEFGYASDKVFGVNGDKLEKLGFNMKYDIKQMLEKIFKAYINQFK